MYIAIIRMIFIIFLITNSLCYNAFADAVNSTNNNMSSGIATYVPGVFALKVGNVKVIALSDGTVPQDLHKLLTNTTVKHTNKLLSNGFRKNPVEASINAFLIDTGNEQILVDTGAGEFFGKIAGGKLLSTLYAAGYRAEDIDKILITHIHTDHSGGLTVNGEAQFPNATVYAGKADIDFFMDKRNAKIAGYAEKYFDEAQTALEPYINSNKVISLVGNQTVIKGLTAIPTPGHTPGHYFYRLQDGNESLFFLGDIVHVLSVQFPDPNITIVYDVDAKAAAKQRNYQFNKMAKNKSLIAAAHLPFPGIGNIRAEGIGFTFVPVDFTWR